MSLFHIASGPTVATRLGLVLMQALMTSLAVPLLWYMAGVLFAQGVKPGGALVYASLLLSTLAALLSAASWFWSNAHGKEGEGKHAYSMAAWVFPAGILGLVIAWNVAHHAFRSSLWYAELMPVLPALLGVTLLVIGAGEVRRSLKHF